MSNNISGVNKDVYNKYKISDIGTVIINTIDENNIEDLIKELKYRCNLHYYKFIKDGLRIEFNYDSNKWELNKDNVIDLTGLNSKNNVFNFKIYKGSKCFYIKDNQGENMKKINTDNKIIVLNKHNKVQWSKEFNFIDKITEEIDLNKFITFRFIVTEPYTKVIKDKLGLENFKGIDYNGLYIERNNRIISKPIALSESIRQDQDGTRYRGKIEYNGKDFDDLIPVQVTKSQLNAKDIDKGLKRTTEILSNQINKYYKKYQGDKFKEFFEDINGIIEILPQQSQRQPHRQQQQQQEQKRQPIRKDNQIRKDSKNRNDIKNDSQNRNDIKNDSQNRNDSKNSQNSNNKILIEKALLLSKK